MVFISVAPNPGFSSEGKDKKGNKKSELVVASLEAFGPETKTSIYRGEIITINAQLKNDNASKSGPFEVRIYLSSKSDGTNIVYEFDVFHDVSLDKSTNRDGMNTKKEEFDSFHNVSQDKSGNVSVTGRYAFPFSVGAGYTYWVVVEATPNGKAIESGENKTKAVAVISVPCDQFEAYIDGDTYNCPFKPGKED
jgi:hypothetical protein